MYFSSITIEILISEVEIIWMLMPSSASDLKAVLGEGVGLEQPPGQHRTCGQQGESDQRNDDERDHRMPRHAASGACCDASGARLQHRHVGPAPPLDGGRLALSG